MTETKTTETTEKPKAKHWVIDAGNSSTGPCGFVLRGIRAESKEEALRIVQGDDNYIIPEELQDVQGREDDQPNAHLSIYFNTRNLTLDDVYEDEDEYDEDDEDGD